MSVFDPAKDNVLTITRNIEKAEERQYLSVPFELPADVDRVDIRYSYKKLVETRDENGNAFREEVNIVDIALEDENHHLIGASGSARQHIFVHEDYGAPGYGLGRPIPQDTWYIILGAYKIQPEGCRVEIEVTFTFKKRQLIKGDTHTHTVHSDGQYLPNDNIAQAKRQKLDFLFLTDHNTTTQNAYALSDEALTVLPGMEATYYDGHCNMFGVARPIRSYVANTREQVLANMREAKERGALISINHAFSDCDWRFGFGEDVPFDLMEVWNGTDMVSNLQCVGFWHGLLCEGKKIPIIGGSDNHRYVLFNILGTPTTFLYSKSKSSSDILAAMRSGSGFISLSQDGPILDIATADEQYFMGQTIPGGYGQPLRLSAERLAAGDEIIVLSDQGEERRIVAEGQFGISFELPIQDRKFYRVEVWRQLPGIGKMLASISNPVYVGEEI